MPTASSLDVYRDWLGIEETARPLNHYQLLRLKQFEDDASKYPQRYRRMTGHVRKFAPAEHAEQAKKLIGEVVGAMLCLSDARRKRDQIDIWRSPLVLGQSLPTLPLALSAGLAIPVDFETTYAEACRRKRLTGS